MHIYILHIYIYIQEMVAKETKVKKQKKVKNGITKKSKF
jgi:uncharacterized membrane protein